MCLSISLIILLVKKKMEEFYSFGYCFFEKWVFKVDFIWMVGFKLRENIWNIRNFIILENYWSIMVIIFSSSFLIVSSCFMIISYSVSRFRSFSIIFFITSSKKCIRGYNRVRENNRGRGWGNRNSNRNRGSISIIFIIIIKKIKVFYIFII